MGNGSLKVRGGLDERNLARLGLILGPRRLSTPITRWERKLTVDVLGTIEIVCVAQADAVVPFGFDNDIMVGLVNCFVALGAPQDGVIRVTPAELLKFAGIAKNGQKLSEMPASINRLQNSNFKISHSWRGNDKKVHILESFSLINGVAFIDISDIESKSTQLPPTKVGGLAQPDADN